MGLEVEVTLAVRVPAGEDRGLGRDGRRRCHRGPKANLHNQTWNLLGDPEADTKVLEGESFLPSRTV
jgi:hypothetical protein